ncbi:hypothetical protein GLYMA_08G306050v4 [Glycine max]|nr:hypothetical protein GLYMA_08G306050v4 [Glycine max]KAH1053932.1 hypothetical protein GYH30_022935 [Glycine max]
MIHFWFLVSFYVIIQMFSITNFEETAEDKNDT